MEESRIITIRKQDLTEASKAFASFIAAATLVPLLIPHNIPSFNARSLEALMASSSFIMQISSIMF